MIGDGEKPLIGNPLAINGAHVAICRRVAHDEVDRDLCRLVRRAAPDGFRSPAQGVEAHTTAKDPGSSEHF